MGLEARAEPDLLWRSEEDGLPAYRLQLESRVTRVRRREFGEPVFLFQQPLEDLIAKEFRSELKFQFRLFSALYAEFDVPYTWRQVDARFASVLVSRGEELPGRWLDLQSKGVGDPSAALILRLHESPAWMLQSHLGVVIPRDDNPGSSTVPSRVPLGNGQLQLFVQPSLGVRLGGWHAAIDYRLGVHPGGVSTYLIRKVGEQTYAAGALAPYVAQRARLSLTWAMTQGFWLSLTPEAAVWDNPRLIERGRAYRFMQDPLRWDYGAEVRLGMELSRSQQLACFYKHWFRQAWQEDPFFPIDIPDQGFGLAWTTRGF